MEFRSCIPLSCIKSGKWWWSCWISWEACLVGLTLNIQFVWEVLWSKDSLNWWCENVGIISCCSDFLCQSEIILSDEIYSKRHLTVWPQRPGEIAIICEKQWNFVLYHWPQETMSFLFVSGFPEHMLFSEFRRRFEILHVPQDGKTGAMLDDKQAVELLLRGLEVDKTTYRLGLSQVRTLLYCPHCFLVWYIRRSFHLCRIVIFHSNYDIELSWS